MKKPLKVMSATALAATFAASSIIPTAVAAAENEDAKTYEIQSFLLVKDGKPYKIEKKVYNSALLAGVQLETVGFIVSDNNIYDMKSYNSALIATKNNSEEAIKLLEKNNLVSELDKVGKVEFDKKTPIYVWDEQPEDRLNETFFYNVA